MSSRSWMLDDALYDYLIKVSLREPDVLRRLREETMGLERSGMLTAPEESQFLALLAEILGARSVLEIGTFTGYTTLRLALALPAGGRVVTCDTSHEWTALARRYWREAGMAERIELRLGPAADTLSALKGESAAFDLAFIDADKEGYALYYQRCLELVRPGGVIAFDNMLWRGRVADPADTDEDTRAIRRLAESLHGDERVSISLVPIGDGVTLARVRAG